MTVDTITMVIIVADTVMCILHVVVFTDGMGRAMLVVTSWALVIVMIVH